MAERCYTAEAEARRDGCPMVEAIDSSGWCMKDEPERVAPLLAGISAEYFVAAELSRRGFIASLTLRNTRGIDVLASDGNASKSVGIQVKGNQGHKTWLLNKKAETFVAPNFFCVFVRLTGRLERPEFYVVPSKAVASQTKTSHARWLATPGKRGRRHKDNPMRAFERRGLLLTSNDGTSSGSLA